MSRMVQSRYKQAAAKKSANATLMSEETLNESAFVRNMGQNTASTSSPLKSRPAQKINTSKTAIRTSRKLPQSASSSLRPSSSMSSLSSMSSSTKDVNKKPEKVPYANGTTHWPNGSPMTKIEISSVHMLNAQDSIIKTINDPDKLKEVRPEQLQRILAYQTWFNESFQKNAIKERDMLEKKQETDFNRAIKTLEEVSALYEEKKAMAEEIQTSRLAREELALLEEMMPKLAPVKEFVEENTKDLNKDDVYVCSKSSQDLLEVSAVIYETYNRVAAKIEQCGSSMSEVRNLIELKKKEADLKLEVEKMEKKLAVQKEKEAAFLRAKLLEDFANNARKNKGRKISIWNNVG